MGKYHCRYFTATQLTKLFNTNLYKQGRYFLITADEAREAFGSASDLYWNDAVGGYMAG